MVLDGHVELDGHVVRRLGVKPHVLVLGHQVHVVSHVDQGHLHVEARLREPMEATESLDDGDVLLAHDVAGGQHQRQDDNARKHQREETRNEASPDVHQIPREPGKDRKRHDRDDDYEQEVPGRATLGVLAVVVVEGGTANLFASHLRPFVSCARPSAGRTALLASESRLRTNYAPCRRHKSRAVPNRWAVSFSYRVRLTTEREP